LKRDDDQSHKNVDEEKREDDEIYDVEDCNLNTDERRRALVFFGRVHGKLPNTNKKAQLK